jgi:hypothetical protein
VKRGAACAAALFLLAAGAARADDCAECRYAGDLSALFVAPRALGPGWESLSEAAADPRTDAGLLDAGVLASHSLHYTHAVRGGSEVCSAEIWRFASPAQARAAESDVRREGWRVAVHGNLIVMLHGVSLRLGERLRPGLVPACHRLGALFDESVEAALRGVSATR